MLVLMNELIPTEWPNHWRYPVKKLKEHFSFIIIMNESVFIFELVKKASINIDAMCESSHVRFPFACFVR